MKRGRGVQARRAASGSAASTQTISWVIQSISNVHGTITAGSLYPLTNMPTMFADDYFVVSSTATDALSVVVIGDVFD